MSGSLTPIFSRLAWRVLPLIIIMPSPTNCLSRSLVRKARYSFGIMPAGIRPFSSNISMNSSTSMESSSSRASCSTAEKGWPVNTSVSGEASCSRAISLAYTRSSSQSTSWLR